MKGDLIVAIRGYIREVAVPPLAWIDAELLAGFAGQEIPGAFDVLSGKGLAVMPLDALAQRQGQLGSLFAPRPTGGKVRDDRLQAVLRHVLLVHDEIIENPHHRPVDRDRRLFEQRHACRTVEMGYSQHAALFLGECHANGAHAINTVPTATSTKSCRLISSP